MASKFILIIFISHAYTLSNLGEYALIVAGVSYVSYLLGFDFYTYSSRKIIGSPKNEQSSFLKNQFFLYFTHYFLAILITCLFVLYEPSLKMIAIIFVVLIILDHCSQEVMRLLVVYEYPFSANLQFFIRNGLWVYAYIPYAFINPDIPFYTIWFFWIAAEIISVFFIIIILKNIPLSLIVGSKIDHQWIFQGLKVCFPLLISTLSLRGIFTADRYILGYFGNKEIVGIYSYFSSFSSSIMAFVDASVVMLFYPRLVRYSKEGLRTKYFATKQKFLKAIIITSLCITAMLILGVPYISKVIGKENFLNSLSLFYILLLGSVMYCISLVYHFDLYARNLDRYIIKSSILAFLVTILLMVVLGYFYSSIGIAISQFIGITVLFIAKYRFCKLGTYD
ncbi:lipopolysaccharide biosynthesis protein [Kosakonia pseudosacchari]|uniref:lipopolysaccharide biosynthesis protein n=1 Tax=Kosakonia pseudosacchari TaxID=1646340 RepID=UPI00187F1CDA|nr:hypothetical protein [Kosakonia pseudosacchari]QOV62489.1 hypothetical protein IP581_14570 [Kosakonia pseudosacchari]